MFYLLKIGVLNVQWCKKNNKDKNCEYNWDDEYEKCRKDCEYIEPIKKKRRRNKR